MPSITCYRSVDLLYLPCHRVVSFFGAKIVVSSSVSLLAQQLELASIYTRCQHLLVCEFYSQLGDLRAHVGLLTCVILPRMVGQALRQTVIQLSKLMCGQACPHNKLNLRQNFTIPTLYTEVLLFVLHRGTTVACSKMKIRKDPYCMDFHRAVQ